MALVAWLFQPMWNKPHADVIKATVNISEVMTWMTWWQIACDCGRWTPIERQGILLRERDKTPAGQLFRRNGKVISFGRHMKIRDLKNAISAKMRRILKEMTGFGRCVSILLSSRDDNQLMLTCLDISIAFQLRSFRGWSDSEVILTSTAQKRKAIWYYIYPKLLWLIWEHRMTLQALFNECGVANKIFGSLLLNKLQ